MSDWLSLPLIDAPAATDRSKIVIYKISEGFIRTNANIIRRVPIFQLWAHLVGVVPPIHNISILEKGPLRLDLTTLKDSVACFRGVKRPYDDESEGESIIVYVLNVDVTVGFDPTSPCMAKAVRLANDALLTFQVKPTNPLLEGDIEIVGIVTRVERVVGEGSAPCLPYGYEERYRERLW
jgi:hypothetical protein